LHQGQNGYNQKNYQEYWRKIPKLDGFIRTELSPQMKPTGYLLTGLQSFLLYAVVLLTSITQINSSGEKVTLIIP